MVQAISTVLGHVINRAGYRPQQDKVAAIKNWPALETVEHVRQFLGLAGFYRRYIQGFSDLAHPLTKLTKSLVPWEWVRSRNGLSSG